jgi:hypothetical protein
MRPTRDITQQRFGKLVALRRDGYRGVGVAWLCACDCGNTHRVTTSNLVSGQVRSCGCSKRGSPLKPEQRAQQEPYDGALTVAMGYKPA